MSLSAASADDRAGQLLTLTERLSERLAIELAAFEARRPHEVAPTIAETQDLANLYRRESARVKANPALLQGMSEALRVRLLAATERFDELLGRHNRALEAARTITEGLVQAIAREVAEARANPTGYGQGGQAAGTDMRAVTLNRTA